MWLTRDFNGKPGWSALLPEPTYASDGTVAIIFAILLFIIRPEGPPIMDWESTAKCASAIARLPPSYTCVYTRLCCLTLQQVPLGHMLPAGRRLCHQLGFQRQRS